MRVFILSVFSLLIFVLNIPGTMTLRNILAILLLLSLVTIWLKNRKSNISIIQSSKFRNIVLILLGISIYVFLHSVFISQDMAWSLSEFKSHWIYPMLYFFIGTLLVFTTQINSYFDRKIIITFLFFSMFLHILYVDIFAIVEFIKTGDIISRYGGLTASPVLANYLTNILLAMLISEGVYRFRTNKNVLKISNNALAVFLLFCIFSSFVEGMRFGVISLFFIGITGIIFFLVKNNHFSNKLKSFISMLIVIVFTMPLIYNLKYDERWLSLIETVSIALDTKTNKSWRNTNSKLPRMTNGEEVSDSNYLRIAWSSKGIEYIYNEPFGIGFGRNAFGHFVQKYEGIDSARGMHSHSSIIDWALGVGLIGLLLWLVFIYKVLFHSFGAYVSNINYYAMLSFFFTSGFFFRSIVDSNMRDHMFLQFMLMLGISLSLMFYEQKKFKNGLNNMQNII